MIRRIVSDSSCDIWNLDGVDFASVALTISTDERTFVDDEKLDIEEMVNYLAKYKSRSYTACPGIDSWMTAFDGADELYVVTLTSGLSGTYNSAMSAKALYLESHPDAHVYVCDTLSTAAEQLLIIEKIAELIKANMNFEDICAAVEEYKKSTHLFFCLKSLHNFAENGRVSKILAQAIGVLGISILGKASEEGTIEPIAKCRGQQCLINNLIKELESSGYNGGKVNVGHVNNDSLAKAFCDALETKYPQAETKIYPTRGICAFYAEAGGLLVGCEC